MKNRDRIRSLPPIATTLIFFILPHFVSLFETEAATNFWTKTTSGNWDEPVWSLGVLPDSSQSVQIVNSGWKAVAIDPSTVANFPSSLTVSNLVISNFGGETTLLLNFVGEAVPLRVLNGFDVDYGRVVNLNSALIVESGIFSFQEGEFDQDGGLVQATNGITRFGIATYYLTNGTFKASDVFIGTGNASAAFVQFGGDATIGSLNFGDSKSSGGSYALEGGNLTVGTLGVAAYPGEFAAVTQSGGTNQSEFLEVGGSGSYLLSGGLLQDSNAGVSAGDGPVAGTGGNFTQNGGVHRVIDTLGIGGSIITHAGASYALNSGELSAESLLMHDYGVFNQSNGTASVSGSLVFQASGGIYQRPIVHLNGGTFACSNVTSLAVGISLPAGGDISQTGGALIVSNLFSFDGSPQNSNDRYARYDFSGGTLTASNIEISADFIIGSSAQAGRISNPGHFALSHLLRAGDATEQLGHFILRTNAVIDLGDGNAKISFANSSGETWNNSVLLIVSNWSGSLTGGGNDQLRFGNDSSGLTSAQLSQIRFTSPPGLPPGNYAAQILNNGEIVPVVPGALFVTLNGSNLILNWSGDFILQTATNVAGPYEDLPEATSPYTQAITDPQRFFRLRQ